MEELLEQYEESAREFCRAVKAVSNPLVKIEGSEWNAHQLAVHTRDVETLVYGLRLRRTLEENDPLFTNFDGDAWMAEHYDPNEPLASVLDELLASVLANAARLRNLPPEAWTRTSRHEAYSGSFTAQTWLERSLAHIEEHLKTVS